MSNRIFYDKYAKDKNNIERLRNLTIEKDLKYSTENYDKRHNGNIQSNNSFNEQISNEQIEETVKEPFDMNSYKRKYYLKNKDTIRNNAKRCEMLKRHAIKKEIYKYEPKFDVIDLRRRRSILNEILICHFNIRLIYIDTSYNDFVDEFNEVCDVENDFDNVNFIDDKQDETTDSE